MSQKPAPPITPEEARQALDLIESTSRQMRRLAAYGGMPYFLIVWGIVWVVGFSANYFVADPSTRGTIWMALDALGLLGTAYVVWHIHKRGVHWPMGPTVGWFWFAWMVYGALFVYFAQARGTQLSMLISLWVMFGYVVSGLFYRSRLLITLGLTVTVFIVVGYVALPAYFDLWMAVLGGGSLVVAGVYMLTAWR